MTLRMFTTAEKLSVVEALIEQIRMTQGRDDERLDVLKAIALDLRGRANGAPSAALVDIEQRVVAVVRSKYAAHALHGLGEGVAVNWPVIKQALERFGAAGEIER